MNPEKNKYGLLAFMIFIFALEAGMFLHDNYTIDLAQRTENIRIEKIREAIDSKPILAKAVSVYNISKNKKIYGKNDTISLPIASLAKIMTVVKGLDNLEKDSVISITPIAISQNGDFGLFSGEEWDIEDLAKLTLVVSANDGAYMLGHSNDFIEAINNKVKRLGAANTNFLNSTGLDLSPVQAGALASAEDVNTMAIYARMAYPEVFSATVAPELELTSTSGVLHKVKNTNIIIPKIPDILFSKTGYTDVAGGSLVIIFKDKRGEEIAVTLLGSTFEGRFTDMEKIVEVLYNN